MPEPARPVIVRSSRSADRLDRALRWVSERGREAELLVVASSLEAGRDLLLRTAGETGAAFGWRRTTLDLLARDLSAVPLALEGRVMAGRLASEAVIARGVAELGAEGALGAFDRVADTPGFVAALSATLADLRSAALGPDDVRPVAPELAAILERHQALLGAEALADRAASLERAAAVARDPGAHHLLLDLPTLFLDVPIRSRREAELVEAVASRARDVLVTVPHGDAGSLAHLEASFDADEAGAREGRAAMGGAGAAAVVGSPAGAGRGRPAEVGRERALDRLQTHLFEDTGPGMDGDGPAAADGSLAVFSAPGENRECVEIVRKVLSFAAEGIPFDRMAIFLRSPEEHRAHVREAFARAGIPAHFDRGTVLPDPAGRAFLALLRCRSEAYSARRFAEYLSLGEVPDAAPDGSPPPAPPSGERWSPPDEEGRSPLSDPGASGERRDAAPDAAPGAGGAADGPPVREGTLRAPRRWERLIVEASVVGGLDRWRRRLRGLGGELRQELEGLDLEEGSGARRAGIERDLRDLESLRAYALPLLEELETLPAAAPWATWLDRLSALAARSLRRPDRVQTLLTDLAPLGPVGPVDLAEVIRVLSRHLLELSRPPGTDRFGKVFVAPTEEARGRRFDVVFVPGLAERLFPKEIREDPVLLDAARTAIAGPGLLPTQEDRIREERLALRLAVGAATRRVVLSYPRMDPIQSRPRVPSFYALEALRAAEGRLPLFEELRARADAVTEARVGWPAPRRPEQAIDEAEYDLAVLESIHGRPILGRRPARGEGPRPGGDGAADGTADGAADAATGAAANAGAPPEATDGSPAAASRGDGSDHAGLAHYLLGANPHLGRALRARAYRWNVPKWSRHDGFAKPSEAAAEALARYRVRGEGARPVSATALQNYAVCPYKFFLSSVHRLSPREDPRPIDSLDPLQKGSLIHDIMFETFSRLGEEGLLPVTGAGLDACLARLDECVDRVAGEHRERLVPAIERVWEDGIEAIRADLRRWLRDVARAEGGWVPWRFELSFGVPRRAPRDPHSRAEPVALEAGGTAFALRGAIDLVERRADGAVRVTDYKTGRVRVTEGATVDGGKHLQPVLYPLALEELVPGARVVSGRLYYCTAAGGFHVHEVPLDDGARRAVGEVVERVAEAVENEFLPAAPDEGACRWCDYLPVCGPAEEARTARKDPLPGLARLRGLR